MILIVTGSRHWKDPLAIAMDIQRLKPSMLVLGDCRTGADSQAKMFAQLNHVPFDVCYADWDEGRKAGPKRNGAMVKLALFLSAGRKPIVCLGFPIGKGWSGTRDCMSQAKAASIRVVEHGTGEVDALIAELDKKEADGG